MKKQKDPLDKIFVKKHPKKKYKKDYTTIALASCLINSWKEYKRFEKELIKRLEERGFKETPTHSAESFISDEIIGYVPCSIEEYEKNYKKLMRELMILHDKNRI